MSTDVDGELVGWCLACGDEWYGREAPKVCPECHSHAVISTVEDAES